MTNEAAVLRELREEPANILEALERDRQNPRAWHAPDEAIEGVRRLARRQDRTKPPAMAGVTEMPHRPSGQNRGGRIRGNQNLKVRPGGAREKDIIRRYRAGEAKTSIARAVGISHWLVLDVLRRTGVVQKRRGRG